MIKVLNISVEEIKNAACNDVNYPYAVIELSNGKTLRGCTCGCRCGCDNTWRLPFIGAQFDSMDNLYRFLRNEPPIDREDAVKYVKLIWQWCSNRYYSYGCEGCPFDNGGYCRLAAEAPTHWDLKEE